jgi:hypothetical protein
MWKPQCLSDGLYAKNINVNNCLPQLQRFKIIYYVISVPHLQTKVHTKYKENTDITDKNTRMAYDMRVLTFSSTSTLRKYTTLECLTMKVTKIRLQPRDFDRNGGFPVSPLIL